MGNKKGLCFRRSLVLQKLMLLNGINVRPVFLYSNPTPSSTNRLEFLKRDILIHNIFEFQFEGIWHVMPTLTKMYFLWTLSNYLDELTLFVKPPRYIRYLNNRNGRFVAPAFLPDIYGI